MNKKALVLLSALCLGATVGCGNDSSSVNTNTNNNTNTTPAETKETYSIGFGYTTSFKATQAAVNVAVAAFGEDGKILAARLDVVQIPLAVVDGVAGIDAANKNAACLSKVELGTDYNMLNSSAIKKEVYQQIESFANWTVGKTVDEVVAGTPGAGHGEAINTELATEVTITVDDFENALKDAYANKKAATEGTAANAGVGIYVEMYGANELTTYVAGAITNEAGVAEAVAVDNVVFPLAVVDGAAALDTTSKYVAEDGSIISKKKLGEDYKMDDYMEACTEDWYKQAAHIEDFVVGKDAAAIKGLTYTDGKNADLSALGATIIVDSIMKSVEEAVSYSTLDVITAKPVK